MNWLLMEPSMLTLPPFRCPLTCSGGYPFLFRKVTDPPSAGRASASGPIGRSCMRALPVSVTG